MTREERRQRRRSNRLMILCFVIVAVWIALLVCSRANAACAAEAATEPDRLTESLAFIGACWVSWALVRVIIWIDTPRRRRKGA